MPLRRGILTTLCSLTLCFGIGLGLAPALRSAHACSCVGSASWRLTLEQITGDGDPAVEQAYWPAEASLSDYQGGSLYLGENHSLALERQP
jgi:hypothetical protein